MFALYTKPVSVIDTSSQIQSELNTLLPNWKHIGSKTEADFKPPN